MSRLTVVLKNNDLNVRMEAWNIVLIVERYIISWTDYGDSSHDPGMGVPLTGSLKDRIKSKAKVEHGHLEPYDPDDAEESDVRF